MMIKRLTSPLAAVMSATILAGCANFPTAIQHGGNPFTQPFTYEEAQGLQASGTDFKSALIKEYQALATKEGVVWSDWFDSDFFARKAIKISEADGIIGPEDPANWRFTTEELTQFAESRQQLLAALNEGVGDFPMEAAKAQASFDCWVEEEEEGWQNDEIAKCKDQFAAALKVLQGVIAEKPTAELDMAKLYTVFFDFDSAEITSVGRLVLQALVEDWGKEAVTFELTGHTDSAGSKSYNEKLSLRRAQAVKSFVAGMSVAESKMTTAGVGETSLAVPTADGVREAKNRRVVIEVK
ncbi:MAG: OmpA family protein [Methylocystaceae bacterium]|nr:OmpA family protein [Methylocystaceae bacterium]